MPSVNLGICDVCYQCTTWNVPSHRCSAPVRIAPLCPLYLGQNIFSRPSNGIYRCEYDPFGGTSQPDGQTSPVKSPISLNYIQHSNPKLQCHPGPPVAWQISRPREELSVDPPDCYFAPHGRSLVWYGIDGDKGPQSYGS